MGIFLSRVNVILALLICICVHQVWSLTEQWRGQDFVVRTRNRPELQWDWGHTWTKVEIDKQPISVLLSHVLGTYRFTLPRTQVGTHTSKFSDRATVAWTGSCIRSNPCIRGMQCNPGEGGTMA